MPRRRSCAMAVVAGFATASLALALQGAGGDAAPASVARSCPPLTVAAVIGGHHRCLRAGENCSVRFRSEYRLYGYRCIAGALRTTAHVRRLTA
jgi:hypothetical protein